MALQSQAIAQTTFKTGNGYDSIAISERAYKPCEKGDVSPNEWDTGGIQLGSPSCGFKNIFEYGLLVDTLQNFDYIEGFMPVTWGIIQGGVLIEEHHDWSNYKSSSFKYITEIKKDTVGAIISLNGVLYQRYMPHLNINQKDVLDLGYEPDQSIPLCGCLRRVKVNTEKINPKKTVEVLYSGSGHKTNNK